MPAITIVQGAQWGSEAKGAVAGFLAIARQYDFAVRTGAINAGHTVYYNGKPYVMQQLPVAWVSPNTKLVIGAGAYVHLPTLLREIKMVEDATGHSLKDRLLVDARVAVHLDSYSRESADADRHHKIGATGKGCAEAIIHKIRDRGDRKLILAESMVSEWTDGVDQFPNIPWLWCDTQEVLCGAYKKGALIMLEGTQGELLDFHLGPWPYVTSRQTTSAAWVAEAGLSPAFSYEVVLVVRTYPIRVAGNSGPMPHETTWPNLARSINNILDDHDIGDHPMRVSNDALTAWDMAVAEVARRHGLDPSALLNHHNLDPSQRVVMRDVLSEYAAEAMAMLSDGETADLRRLFEFTTVTKKLRRVAGISTASLDHVARTSGASWAVVTFINYRFPHLYGGEVDYEAIKYLRGLPVHVGAYNTGPLPEHMRWL